MACDESVMSQASSGPRSEAAGGAGAIGNTPAGASSLSPRLEWAQKEEPPHVFTCSTCDETKPAGEFHRDGRLTRGLTSSCKGCRNGQNNRRNAEKRAEYLRENGGHLAAERVKRIAESRRRARASEQARRKRRLARMKVKEPERYLELRRRQEHRQYEKRKTSAARRDYERAWRRAHAGERNERRRLRSRADPQFRMADRLRSRLYGALRGRRKTGSAVALLGCSLADAVAHLGRQFRPGMTWENHGPVWHVDHIRPLAGFDLTDPGQLAQACHFTNLQPLWAAENIAKRDRQHWAGFEKAAA